MVKDGLPQHSKKQNLTREKLQRFIPKGTNHVVTDDILKMLNSMEEDTNILQEYMEESVLSHIGVLGEMKVDLIDYVDAIKYCTLKNNMSNSKAWEIVFPERMERLIKLKKVKGDAVNIDSHVSNYNKTKIVVELTKRMLVPPSILYQPLFHEAMMVKVNLMRGIGAKSTDRVSPTVQLAAAIAVSDKTQMPEDNSIELKVGLSDSALSAQEDLMEQIKRHADIAAEQMRNGGELNSVQKLGIRSEAIDAEIEE